MKFFMQSSILAALATTGFQARANHEIVDATIREVFSPVGFDDNDEVSVTIDGYLPNNCYQLMKPTFKITSDGKIEVRQPARLFRDMACLQVLVPFTSTIDFGQVKMGEYKITANRGQLMRSLKVEEAVNKIRPDDFLYAPVESVSFEVKPDKQYIVLSGRFTNTCMDLTEDEIEVKQTGNVIVVRPIMKEILGLRCADVMVPFSVRKEISSSLAAGRYLMHVRSLNGRAVNQVFSVFNDDRM